MTVPAEKGDPRNLTNTGGVHERGPAWSPDGKSIAYFSDAGGEYRLHVRAANGKGDAKTYDLNGAGYYERATWSPDSKKIAFVDNSMSLFWIDLSDGKVTKIASEPHFGPWGFWRLQPAWSPDSKWIAYNLGNKAAYRTIYVHNLADNKSTAVTDGLSDCVDPVFDASGKYLYLFSSTDAGPVNHWFAQSNADMKAKRGAYLVVLKKGVASPLAKESDEEKAESPRPKAKKDDKKDDTKKDAKKDAAEVVIDFDGIDQRVVPLPIPAGDLSNLQAGAAGQIYYLQAPATRGDGPTGSTLQRFDLAKRKTDTVTAGVFDYTIAAGLRKALIATLGGRRAGLTRPADPGVVDHRLGGGIVPRAPARRRRRSRRAQSRCGRSQDRPARGVEANLQRSLAHQPRLLLRPQHARGRLERDQGQVRTVPPAPHDRAATSTASSAGCSPNSRSGIATPLPASGSTTRRRSAAACSARTTRSPTAAIASRRSTAA